MPSTTKMAKPRNQSKPSSTTNKQIISHHQSQKTDHSQKPVHQKQPPSWAVVRGLLTCKHSSSQAQPQEDQKRNQQQHHQQQSLKKQKQKQKLQQKQDQIAVDESTNKKCKKMKCSGSLCSNTKVMHRPDQTTASPELHKKRASSTTSSSNEASSRSMKAPIGHELSGVVSTSNSSSALSVSSSSSLGVGSFRGMPFRRFSGCYECRMVVDPVLGIARDPSLRGTICSCPECGEIFMKPENLELHQAVRHAVSELGPEDTSKNIVEIIFQSSWLKKQNPPICPKIDRILKVHNTQTTISNFESYRDTVKSKATATAAAKQLARTPPRAPNPRCVADGNELLRFHAATFACSLGLDGSTNLCNSVPNCHVCSIIRNGFKHGHDHHGGKGILTTATSGRAHDVGGGGGGGGEKRAMLVCRVIAGRVKKCMESGGGNGGGLEEYDSIAGSVGVYSNLDELYVFNPRAILPCFVVIYSGV